MSGIKRDQADHWFSYVVRAKAEWACECCAKHFGQPDRGLHCAHIYGRSSKSTRWSLDNAVSLCYSCHRYFTEHPLGFSSWLDSYLGMGHLDLLAEKFRHPMKTNAALRKDIAKHYREEAKKLDADPEYTPVSYN